MIDDPCEVGSKSVLESFLDVDVTSALRIPEPASVAARATRLHQNRQEAPLVTLLPNLRPVDLITRKRSHCATNGIGRVRLISSTSGPCTTTTSCMSPFSDRLRDASGGGP